MGIEFDENKPINYGYTQKKGGITNLVIKMGLAKDEAGAQKVMIVMAIIFFALAIYFYTKI